MREKKLRLENHQFYDFHTIERHLEKMAAKGWRLERIGRMGWHYRRAPAKKLTYAVEYFEQGSDFNAALPEGQRTFVEYCEASGWQLVGTWAQMMILVSEEEDPVPIETEPATRLETIRRAMWKNFLPGTIIMVVLAVLQIAMNLSQFFRSPIDAWSGFAVYGMAAWVLLGVMFGARLVNYGLWLRRAGRAVEGGMPLPQSNARWLAAGDYAVLALIIAMMLLQFAGKSLRYIMPGIIVFIGFYINIFFTDRLREFLKRRNVSAAVNRVLSIAFCALFTVALMSGMVWYILRYPDPKPETAGTYTYEVHEGLTRTVTLERDPMPLVLEDLTTVTSEAVSYESRVNGTPFLTYTDYWQQCYDDRAYFTYEVLDVHWDALYEVCLQEWLDDINEDVHFGHRWEAADPAPWGAERVWQEYWNEYDEFSGEYLICWADRIVRLEFDTPLTAEQTAIAAAKLAP